MAKPVIPPHRELSLHPSLTPIPINTTPGYSIAETLNQDPKAKKESGEVQARDPESINLTTKDNPDNVDSNNITNLDTFNKDLGVNDLEYTNNNNADGLIYDT